MVQNNGLEFEYLVQAFFEERGVSVFETPGSNDYGADLVLLSAISRSPARRSPWLTPIMYS